MNSGFEHQERFCNGFQLKLCKHFLSQFLLNLLINLKNVILFKILDTLENIPDICSDYFSICLKVSQTLLTIINTVVFNRNDGNGSQNECKECNEKINSIKSYLFVKSNEKFNLKTICQINCHLLEIKEFQDMKEHLFDKMIK